MVVLGKQEVCGLRIEIRSCLAIHSLDHITNLQAEWCYVAGQHSDVSGDVISIINGPNQGRIRKYTLRGKSDVVNKVIAPIHWGYGAGCVLKN